MVRAAFAVVVVLLCNNVIAGPPDTLWTRVFGGANEEWGWWVEECYDYGFILAGRTFSYPNRALRGYVVKTDEAGGFDWSRVLERGNTRCQAYCVRQTRDSGYVAAGYSEERGFQGILWRLDANGQVRWSEDYGGNYTEYLFEVAQTPDEGFIATGFRYQSADRALYVVKTDAAGNPEWEQLYDRPSCYDEGESVIITLDGGYAVSGSSNSVSWLLKLKPDGDTLWTRSYNGLVTAYSVIQTPDSGFVLAGYVFNGAVGDGAAVRTRANGDTVWQRKFGTVPVDDVFYSVRPTADGCFLFGGCSYSYSSYIDAWLVKLDSLGNLVWMGNYGSDTAGDYAYMAQELHDGGHILGGRTDDHGAGSYDMYLIRTGAGSGVEEVTSDELRVANGATIARGVLRLPIIDECRVANPELLDASGRRVMRLQAGENDVRHLSPGVYFVHLPPDIRHSTPATKVVVTR